MSDRAYASYGSIAPPQDPSSPSFPIHEFNSLLEKYISTTRPFLFPHAPRYLCDALALIVPADDPAAPILTITRTAVTDLISVDGERHFPADGDGNEEGSFVLAAGSRLVAIIRPRIEKYTGLWAACSLVVEARLAATPPKALARLAARLDAAYQVSRASLGLLVVGTRFARVLRTANGVLVVETKTWTALDMLDEDDLPHQLASDTGVHEGAGQLLAQYVYAAACVLAPLRFSTRYTLSDLEDIQPDVATALRTCGIAPPSRPPTPPMGHFAADPDPVRPPTPESDEEDEDAEPDILSRHRFLISPLWQRVANRPNIRVKPRQMDAIVRAAMEGIPRE